MKRAARFPSSVALGFAALALMLFAAAEARAEVRAPVSQAEISLSFAPVVKAAAPAVVNIYAQRVVRRRASPFAGDPFFERFFQGLMPRGRRVENSLGSGVIVSPDGLVVSNFHVVGGADEIRVVLSDRREFDASVLLADEQSDLAVLRLEGASGLPALALRDSDDIEVGDLVLAIGNPFGVGQSVTSGIVSALDRSRTAPNGTGGYYIQTDAPINPGNSGGALVDMAGRLVGVNTLILSPSGGSNGIGFAVPSNLVRQVVAQAEAGRETLARPWSGIVGQAVDGALAEGLGMSRPEGVVISQVHPLSPFGAAGLKKGDVLLSFAGQSVESPVELDFRLASLGVGDSAEARFLRRGKERTVEVRLIAPPETPPRDLRRIAGRGPFSGLTAANMNPALAEEIGAPFTMSGVVILRVEGRARRAGFRPRDLILGANGTEISSTRELESLSRRDRDRWDVMIERNGRRGALRLRR